MFPRPRVDRNAPAVFPACAGMFLIGRICSSTKSCFPRVRGDVPPTPSRPQRSRRFSPRARGCSAKCRWWRLCPGVFPACAGMFLRWPDPVSPGESFPRVRGDVPGTIKPRRSSARFSPRARGYSPLACHYRIPAPSFPRVRGDVPCSARVRSHSAMFSPRARGCS